MKCLMCRKELDLVFPGELSREVAVNDGGTVEVSFGYGSVHDLKMALGFICDDCFGGNLDLFVNHYNATTGKAVQP